ncbi:MAG TPA: hypothetical protein VEA80_17120 [Vitreimonas sp.]|uniref:hypothetical protein n=1 Tax=Vitreimonas sp. TaxID=3069702 RepID=UPI002D358B5F|nr:hypothetical protein [Vitreimonas sp.]HYD89203.1 hypothetical protein [Vitreimonas sp.]
MDRARFEQLLEAYGADFARWPATERVAGERFAEEHAAALAAGLRDAGALDAALSSAPAARGDLADLSARVLAQAPRPAQGFGARASWALAACALLGVVIGYGGGRFAPVATDADEAYFAMAFEAPVDLSGEEG